MEGYPIFKAFQHNDADDLYIIGFFVIKEQRSKNTLQSAKDRKGHSYEKV